MKFFLTILFSFIIYVINAQTLVRGPYLTNASSSSVFIHWKTDVPSNSVVTYGTSLNNLNNSISNSVLVIHHEIKLTNLLPNTIYYYSVGTNLITLQNGSLNYFKTSPITSKNYSEPIRFWTMGDMGKQTQNQHNVRNSFLKYIDTNHVDGFIMLGDNAYETGSDVEYQNGFFNYYQNDILKNTVIWPCIGNHDYANNYTLRTNFQVPYFDIFALPFLGDAGGVPSMSERYYSYNYGNVHFVNLDSYGLDSVNGVFYGLADTLFSPQITWLKQDLANNQLPWTIVSYHHPAYCMGSHNSDSELDLVALRTNLNPILERYNVDLVLNGHSHSYERSHFMKNHFGMETTFDTLVNAVQKSTGFYDGSINSCAFIKNSFQPQKSDSGTIYAVVGSASALPVAPFVAWPHNAMVSSSMENGSMLLTIEGNRLDAVWISTDTNNLVKDKFTIFKNVNLVDTLFIQYPNTISLTANWKANKYFWSTGDSSKTISLNINKDSVFLVKDEFSCIENKFIIKEGIPLNSFEANHKTNFYIYPNPTNQNISIHFPTVDEFKIQLNDIQGRILKTEKIQLNTLLYQFTFPDNLERGTYFLSICNDKNHSFKSKFIKY